MASLTSLAAKWNLEEYALYRVFMCKLDFSVSPFLHWNYCIAFQLCTSFLPCTTTPITTLIGLAPVKLRPRAAPPVGATRVRHPRTESVCAEAWLFGVSGLYGL
jgi:hypothetical protein